MTVLEFQMLQITNNTNLIWPCLPNFASPTLTLQWATFPSPKPTGDLYFLHVVQDDLFKKLPQFGKFNFGSAKVALVYFISPLENILELFIVTLYLNLPWTLFCHHFHQLDSNKLKKSLFYINIEWGTTKWRIDRKINLSTSTTIHLNICS